MAFSEVRTCIDCGHIFVAAHVKQVRCRECQEIHVKKRESVRAKKRSEKLKKKKYVQNKNVMLTCMHKDCVYVSRPTGGGFMCCDYMLIEGHKRPCKPTPDCTEYRKRQKRK